MELGEIELQETWLSKRTLMVLSRRQIKILTAKLQEFTIQ